MRSPRPPFLWLLEKESRELAVSRSWWVLLFAMGPLTGVSFIHAVRTYGEVSGLNGASGGVGEAMSPLIGVWGPAFSACELAAVFLLPFVAIRVVGGDRQSGALKLEIQQSISPLGRMSAKALVLLAGWAFAMLPPVSALLLWKWYGGTLYAPELLTLIMGHLLNAGLTVGLAAAMSSSSEHPSTAAILTLGTTVGTWILDIFGAVQGGFWEHAAAYTPAALVNQYQHGLLRLDTTAIAVAWIVAAFSFAAVWIRIGMPAPRRVWKSVGVGFLASAAIFGGTFLHASWDFSESRGNSFSVADEQALRSIGQPLRIDVRLAAEDPRRIELEHGALAKLRRVLPDVKVRYLASTSVGLFEETKPGYGEIRYELAGRHTMSRATSAEGVLEAIYSIASVSPQAGRPEDVFRGHPLAVEPKGAGIVFYAVWPAIFLAGAVLVRRSFP